MLLLPHNNHVTKPRVLNTFLDEIAELGLDKGLIKNKKLLSEKDYRNAEDTSDILKIRRSRWRRKKKRKWLLRMAVKLKAPIESENGNENDSQETEKSSLENSTTFHSENPCENCVLLVCPIFSAK